MNNFEKRTQYAILMSKLKKATYNEFYYEAIFIEYAIMEDRTKSLLTHANVKLKDNEKETLNNKLNHIEKDSKFNNKYTRKHIPIELIEQIHEWKKERNKLIHNLVNEEYNSEQIKNLALEGECLAIRLANKSKLVNKYNDKLNNEN